MNVDMAALFRDYGIATATQGEKTCSPGWINLQCCWCDDGGKHLGWNIHGSYFNCWRCGGHRTDDTIVELLNIAEHEAVVVLHRYNLRPGAVIEERRLIVRPDECIVPGSSPLGLIHEAYLMKRGYDSDHLQQLWQLRGTGYAVQGTNKFRIMCPIYYDGRVVSWQGRDITGRSPLRWKSCAKELEVRDHKHCLGGEQLVPGDAVAIVEGFTDAWRLGPGAVCTFGTDYLIQQVSLLRHYKRRFHVLDSADKDPNAQAQADKLANMCSAFPGEDIIAELDTGDPGDMPQTEANYLMTREWKIR